MKKAVRYYSRLGSTKTIAEAIAQGAGVRAVSITEEPELTEPVDVLFLGGAPYANIMAPELKAYAEKAQARDGGQDHSVYDLQLVQADGAGAEKAAAGKRDHGGRHIFLRPYAAYPGPHGSGEGVWESALSKEKTK